MADKPAQVAAGPAYRFNYDLLIKTVSLALPGTVKIFVVLKRGTLPLRNDGFLRAQEDRDQVEADRRQAEHLG